MRDTLEALAAGDLTVDEAEATLCGYVTGDNGRFDVSRESRRGIPEAIYAPGKSPGEVTSLAMTAVDGTGRAIVTRADEAHERAIRDRIGTDNRDVSMSVDDAAGVVVVRAADFTAPSLDVTAGVITAGTVDAGPAGEAAAILNEVGVDVVNLEDVGVANLTRLTDQLDVIRACDVLIVAAGREGALPTVVAGLVDAPVIGLPVSSGYGHGGAGEAALAGMLQSCTVLSAVNIDAGFVAGAQAALIARAIDA